MNLNKSLVARFVSLALSTTTTVSLATTLSTPEKIKSPQNTLTQTYDNRVSISGMTNQFDAQLGKTTFQWATKKALKPNVSAIAPEHQNTFAADFYLNQLTGAKKTAKV
ncbi:hypothetical protein [Colwellia sp. 20A7]|uniref:hypothetical protein n=1 Tax=Colwellia sp. 20A7 TaxID=2689569 RepID=UPI001357EAB8|nr:hypothetical protein [Colwellia sp. 20A7]